MNVVQRAIHHIGLSPIAQSADIYPSAVQKWLDTGRLPRTELMGLTGYAAAIERLSGGKFAAAELIEQTRRAWSDPKWKAPARRPLRGRRYAEASA